MVSKAKAILIHLGDLLFFVCIQYGISGCGVFKAGIQNQKGFWLKINCIQMKLPNFENWSNGDLSKIGHHFSNIKN